MSSKREELLAELGHQVRRSQRATDSVDEAVQQLMGVNRTDSRCLDILDEREQMTAGELAREARLTTGAITAVLDRLERAGYVRRVADPSDRRRVLVEPTPLARRLAWELFGPMVESAQTLLRGYTDEQLQLFIDFQRLGAERQEQHAEWLRARPPLDRDPSGVTAP